MADKVINIPIGSGNLFETEFTGAIPADSVIETEANRIGRIEKGATCQYKPTTKTFKDDYGIQQRTVLTDEEVTLKASLISWSSANLDVYSLTGRVTETQGHRTVKIGGLGNASGKKYLWRFVHPDKEFGDVRLTVVGTNTGGFTLTYKPDDAGNMDLEITAQPSDNEGTRILYDEEVLGDTIKASGLAVSSAAGTTSGTTKLTVTPTHGTGDAYRLFHGAESPAIGAVLTGWTAWDGTSDITAATGDILTVAEVDSAGKAVKAGICTVTAKA
jgi:hypothetical protein